MSMPRSVAVRLSAEVSGYISSMRQAGAETKKALGDASKYAADHSRALDDLGGTAGKVGLAAATGLGLVTKAAMDWESAWAGVEKTVDGNAVQMAALEGELRGLAKTLPATHAEIAGVAEAAGQLGVERDAIAGFTRTMIDLGETTNLSAEEAATSIAQMANVMGTAPDEIDNLGAALVALGNDGASTEKQIIEMAQRISGAGAQIGLAESDILAIANASASMGVEVEAGGTAISQTFTKMAKAVAQGGDDLDRFAEAAGVSSEEFVRSFRDDPAEAFATFVGGLRNINESGGDVFTTLEGLELSGIRVSQSLLGLAASGDLLTDSLALGDEAWEANTALALEAAKRYDTSAAKVQIAWNNIKDAAIEFGEAALPLVAGVADKVAGLASVIGGLPQPVRTASTSLLGITAVLGGGLWFTAKAINGVTSMRSALADLGPAGTKATRALKGVVAAFAVVELAAAVDSFVTRVDQAPPGIEAMTKALLEFSDATVSSQSRAELDAMADSIDRLIDPKWNQATDDWLRDKLPLFGDAGDLKEASADVEALDAALANLVATGNKGVAADWLGGLDPEKAKALAEYLPQYDEALAAIENDAKLAADGNDALAGSQRAAADAARAQADALLKAVDAMKEQREEAIRGMNAEIDYQASLDDARKALKENGKTLDITTEKGRANKTALLQVAAAWNDQSDAARNAPGAHRAAIRSFVDLAEKMGMSRREAQNLARDILNLPNKKVTVTADTGPAMREILRISAARIPDKSFRVTAVYGTAGATYDTRPSIGGGRSADGSTVPKDGGPYADRYPYLLAPGEEVISNRNGQADRWRPLLKAINYGRLADGGTVGRLADGGKVEPITNKDLRQFNLTAGLGVDGVRSELREFREAIRDANREWTASMEKAADRAVRVARRYEKVEARLSKAQGRLEQVRADRSAYNTDVRSTFNGDIFGNGLAGMSLQLRADTNDAEAMRKALRAAQDKGLDGALFQALAASGDLNTAQQMAGLSKKQIRSYEQMYAARAQAQAQLGNMAAREVYGAQTRAAEQAVTHLNRELKALRRTMEKMEVAVERGVARGMAGGAGRAGQRRRGKK